MTTRTYALQGVQLRGQSLNGLLTYPQLRKQSKAELQPASCAASGSTSKLGFQGVRFCLDSEDDGSCGACYWQSPQTHTNIIPHTQEAETAWPSFVGVPSRQFEVKIKYLGTKGLYADTPTDSSINKQTEGAHGKLLSCTNSMAYRCRQSRLRILHETKVEMIRTRLLSQDAASQEET